MTESCSVCGSRFEQQFRYQMEETPTGFAFYCSQECLNKSRTAWGDGCASCDTCGKRFQVELVSSVFYVAGQRKYACSQACRGQLLREAGGARLGELLGAASGPPAVELLGAASGRPAVADMTAPDTLAPDKPPLAPLPTPATPISRDVSER